jgi:hypothetical protein
VNQELQPPFALYRGVDNEVYLLRANLEHLKSGQIKSISLAVLSADDFRDSGKSITVKYGERFGPTGLHFEPLLSGDIFASHITGFDLTISKGAYEEIINHYAYTSRCNGGNDVTIAMREK